MKHVRHSIAKVITLICLMFFFTPFAAYSIEVPTSAVPTATTDDVNTVMLELSTDKNQYTTGDIIQFTIAMAGDALIDIYMSATFSDGTFASYSTSLMPDAASSIIPLLKNIPLASIAGTYTLPLPVIPLWPEGTSEIWVVFVKAGKNPMMSVNWLADYKVSFTVDQKEDVVPLFDLESKTFTASLGAIGTLTITFGEATVSGETISGTVEGLLTVALPTGAVREHELTGTYSYKGETITIHLEGDENFYIHITLTINEDGTLTGNYETSDGKSGDIKFNLPVAVPES